MLDLKTLGGKEEVGIEWNKETSTQILAVPKLGS